MITEDFIIHFTGNSSTVANGRSLAKGSFVSLFETADGTLLFGSCKGSGKEPYRCSVDFSDAEKPVPRCSCPSRQIPCKHVAGLLFCKLQGKPFAIEAIPEDIAGKRTKAKQKDEKKTEKQDEDPAKAKKAAKAARTAKAKQCRMQLEGVAFAKKMLHNIILSGLNSIVQDKENYQAQIKELGNFYINGIQAVFTELFDGVNADCKRS
jgi:uncharacterized Zn finger protein